MTAIVLFDGVCNLCSAAVRFIVERDPEARFKFASLQSDVGVRLLAEHSIARTDEPETMLLVEDGVVYDRSTAALRVARRLSGLWKLAWAFIVVPRPLRDAAYRFVAKRRYRWFGKQESCMVPTPELRERFL